MTRVLTIALALATLMTARQVAAQTTDQFNPRARAADLSFGYDVTTDSGTEQTLPVGWHASAALRLTHDWSVVAETSGAYKSTVINGVDRDFRVHGFLGGVRLQPWQSARAVPFAQLLVGTACYCGSTLHPGSGYATSFAWQPGVGIDIGLLRRLALRLRADARGIRTDADRFHQFRVSVGASVGLGTRARRGAD